MYRAKDGRMPVPGLPIKRTSNACHCILDNLSPAQTTSQPLICSSAAVTSLSKDPAVTPFCWSVLAIPTSTATSYTTLQPPIVTLSSTNVLTVTSTSQIFATDFGRVVSTDPSHHPVYSTVCGASGQTVVKRAHATPSADIPTYMSGKPLSYITSACKCMTHLGGPTTTVVLPTVLSTVTVSMNHPAHVYQSLIQALTDYCPS